MKNYLALLSLVSTVVLAQDVRQSALPQNSPLLGNWRASLPNGCFEEYTFRANGTRLSRSGAERNESVFEISAHASEPGIYRWVDKIVKNNGQPDCAGSVTPIGDVSTNFIFLQNDGKKFLLCETENKKSCFIEFNKMGRAS
jgi:hypothetical protein